MKNTLVPSHASSEKTPQSLNILTEKEKTTRENSYCRPKNRDNLKIDSMNRFLTTLKPVLGSEIGNLTLVNHLPNMNELNTTQLISCLAESVDNELDRAMERPQLRELIREAGRLLQDRRRSQGLQAYTGVTTRLDALELSEGSTKAQITQLMRVVLALDERLRLIEERGEQAEASSANGENGKRTRTE